VSIHETDELITAAILVAPFLVCAIWLGSILLRDRKVGE
jgi:hypothetical protein